MAADPKGAIVKPPKGPLDLSWLFHVPAETARQARERLAQGQVRLDSETLAGWFCVASGTDQLALDHLEGRAWRKSLKVWIAQENQRSALHNRATLHRLMYLSEEQENRGGHLRKAYELYQRLLTANAGYQSLAQWSGQELRATVAEAARRSDDEMVAKSLAIVRELEGLTACEELQEELMLEELDDLALLTATLMRDLLPYQGVVHVPPRALLMSAQSRTEDDVLPPAVRLAYRLVVGTRQRRRVDGMVAELCGMLSQSMFKGGEGRLGKKWQGEATRWEPQVAQEWKEPEPVHLGDEAVAPVRFTAPQESGAVGQTEDGPRELGPRWFGVRARPALVQQLDAREEWLEALRLFGMAIFPLRRFAVYRNLDTGEIGTSQRLPLKVGDYVWQTVLVVGLSFGIVFGLIRGMPYLAKIGAPPSPAMSAEARQAQLSGAVERLKRLAQVEAELLRGPKPDKKRLDAIAVERQALFEKVQELEQAGGRK